MTDQIEQLIDESKRALARVILEGTAAESRIAAQSLFQLDGWWAEDTSIIHEHGGFVFQNATHCALGLRNLVEPLPAYDDDSGSVKPAKAEQSTLSEQARQAVTALGTLRQHVTDLLAAEDKNLVEKYK